MSNINTIYAFFYTYDYTNTQTTSTYALPFTPLKFVPRLNDSGDFDNALGAPIDTFLSRKRIVWDFGDNTSSEAITGVHYYKEPGQYDVTCYLYDVNGEGYYNTFKQTVNIYNYITDSITLSAPSTQVLQLTAGQLSTPVLVTRNTSWQYYETSKTPQTTVSDLQDLTSDFFNPPKTRTQPTEPYNDTRKFDLTKPVTLVAYISGSSAPNYFDSNLQNTHYGHLYPYSSTFIYTSGANGVTEFIEVSSFETTSTPVYITLSGNSIIHTTSENISSYFVGTSGTQLLYYKDDFGGVQYNPIHSKQTSVLIGYDSNSISPYANTSTVGYSVSVIENKDFNHISVTSNGLDSEGNSTNLFPINANKFLNTKIAFVAKFKDSKGFTIKNAGLLNQIDFALWDLNTNVYEATFESDYGSLSVLDNGGFYKGYCIPTFTSTEPKHNMRIYVEGYTGTDVISGTSNYFSIYPDKYYNIVKDGEDVDLTANITEIATQPLFLDTPVLLNDFLGSIVGTISSSQDSFGKVVYEKTKNFVDNNATLDYSNIDQFLALLKLYNVEEYDFGINNTPSPFELTRLINLLSINYSRLRGTLNQYSENFTPRGYVNNTYSTNLGDELNTQTYVVTAGIPIVTYEKYSRIYTKIDTYNLSGYNNFKGNVITTVDGRIKDKDPLTTKQFLTSSIPYTYTTTAWTNGVDFTGRSLGYNGQYQCVLITPRHGAIPYHVSGPTVGTTFTFVGSDNTTYTKRVSARQHVDSDIDVLLFEDAFPSAVKPFRIVESDVFDAISDSDNIPMVWLARRPAWSSYVGTNAAIVEYYYTSGNQIVTKVPTNTNRYKYFENTIVGDSGSPVGFIYDNEFLLATLWTSTFAGISYGKYLPQIRHTISALATAYSISDTYNVSTFSLSEAAETQFQFPLSAYQNDWGWNLVLPDNDVTTMSTFYKFYSYNYSIDGTHTSNIINYTDPSNTLQYTQSSYTDWAEKDGIISNIISNKLYDKLNLFV